ncbi:MAG: Fe-S cluster assembly protein SufD [Caulobacter sp.]
MSLSTAIQTGDLSQLPSRRDEDWRWTDLRGLIRDIPPKSPWMKPHTVDGPFSNAEGVELIWHVHNGQHAKDFLGANGTIAMRLLSMAENGSHAAKMTFQVPAGQSLTLLESYEGSANRYLAAYDFVFVVEEGAVLERVVLADDGAESVAVIDAEVELSAYSRFSQTVLTTGARRQRIETRIAHPGAEASVRLDGAYLLDGQRHADLTSTVTHGGVDGTTSQLTKGVVRDQARGVFQGRIVVEPGADRTDARMRHQALILSERAEIDAKPELLIFADDVQCAHGNTVGALDEEAIFYARQRGIPADQARAMLTAAFVGEVIDRIEHDGAREVARRWAEQHLGIV